MKVYDFTTKEDVSNLTFMSKIKLAKKTLIENNNLSDDNIQIISDRNFIEYQVEGIEYIGRLIEFEIRDEKSVIGNLNCFKSDNNDCLDISTWQ